MKASNDNYFVELSKINVSDYVEKKGQFSYLSWPYAVSQLRQFDPVATWSVKRFNDLPYLATETGHFVEVAVTVKGITLSQIHPVLDGRNRPIMAPTSFDINTSIQRCLVKAIALHGLGLNIYAGEDLPIAEPEDVTSVRLVTSSTPTGNSEAGAKPATVNSPVPVIAPPTSPPSTSAPLRPASDFITLAQVRYINKLIAETGTEVAKVLEYFGVSRIEDIAKSEASRVIRSLEQARSRNDGRAAA